MRFYSRGFYYNWVERGFRIQHHPGVARAFVRDEPCGEFFYLTDTGGFDLPDHNGPFQIIHFSAQAEILDGPAICLTRQELAAWLSQRSTISIPTDPRI
jgi:hypothetical protein